MCLTLNVDLGKITLWVIMPSMPKLTELLLRCGSKSPFRLFTLHEALFNTLFLLIAVGQSCAEIINKDKA